MRKRMDKPFPVSFRICFCLVRFLVFFAAHDRLAPHFRPKPAPVRTVRKRGSARVESPQHQVFGSHRSFRALRTPFSTSLCSGLCTHSKNTLERTTKE